MSYWLDKSVIITGGGSGIGKALGAGLAQRGAKVWLSDVNGDSAAEAANEIGAGREIPMDLAEEKCPGPFSRGGVAFSSWLQGDDAMPKCRALRRIDQVHDAVFEPADVEPVDDVDDEGQLRAVGPWPGLVHRALPNATRSSFQDIRRFA